MAERLHSWLRQMQAQGVTPRTWPWRHSGDRCTLGPGCPRRRGLADHPSTTSSLHREAQPFAPQFPIPSLCRRSLPRHLATVSTVGARLAPAARAPPCPPCRAGIAPLNPPAPRLQAALAPPPAAAPARYHRLRRAGPCSAVQSEPGPPARGWRGRSLDGLGRRRLGRGPAAGPRRVTPPAPADRPAKGTRNPSGHVVGPSAWSEACGAFPRVFNPVSWPVEARASLPRGDEARCVLGRG